jgi:RNA polymerase sigma factor (sigma-70 family)
MTPEDYFYKYQHIAKETLYRMFPDVKGVARVNRIEVSDLKQIAAIGLWKACISYQPDKGTKFMTHAINHIKWHVTERLKRETSMIKYDSNKFDQIEQYGIMSIDAEHSEDSDGQNTYHDILASDYNLESNVMSNSEYVHILSQLNDRQREIVKLIEKGLNTNDIARLWDMTGSNVRHHYQKAKKLLENYVEVV